MLRVIPDDPPKEVQDHLKERQGIINDAGDFKARVEKSKELWGGKKDAIFGKGRALRATLAASCTGLERCHYCEDSAADEIEHICPRSLYPEKAFDWENYLYSCGPCNGSYKGSKWAVFGQTDDQVIDVSRSRNDPVDPPAKGDPLFINPRHEDPMDFFDLDFQTGMLLSKGKKGSRKYLRAKYTWETVGLNRDFLKDSRKAKYKTFLRSIRDYVASRDQHSNEDDFKALEDEIVSSPHRTVWEHMKRYAHEVHELQTLFEKAPELKEIG